MAQVVRTTVAPGRRDEYLSAWGEWSGTLFTMGIRCELLESREEPGRFAEITWFGPGEQAALGDDRVVRLGDALDRVAEEREDVHRLYDVRR